MSKPSLPQTTTLQGQIERVTFRNEETHFFIAKFKAEAAPGLVTVLGYMPDLHSGETLRLKGNWQAHPRYGQQFKVEAVEILLPAGVDEIRRYLASGLIKGIGPRTAERLIRCFGDKTLEVIEKEPQRLNEAPGIGNQKARQISQAWESHHVVHALMRFLQEYDIKPAYGARIYKTYGGEALTVLRDNPYQLTEDMPRVGFYIYDAILRRSGQSGDTQLRARACLRHLLETAQDEGHMFLCRDEIVQRCDMVFELDYAIVQSALETLDGDHEIKIDREAPQIPVYPYPLFQAETQIAKRLRAFINVPAVTHSLNDEEIMTAVVGRLAVALSRDQLAVVRSALRTPVVIITGGPGTGKTTLIRALTAVFDALGHAYLLAAPTGRAARRMAEITGRPAATLHKLLGFNLTEGNFERDQDNPLETGTVIVDEASMLDALLTAQLIKAMPLKSRLILVGDVHQLPSVGPGTILADLIGTRLFETFELKQIFRQAAQSPLIALAHQVHQGSLPDLDKHRMGERLTDFTFIPKNEVQAVAETIVALCTHIIPEHLGLDGVNHVQVLTPMHKGAVGTVRLNQMLQAGLNPGKAGLPTAQGTFCVGDKVMHLRNNYQKEVFNGEIGTICELSRDHETLWVAYDDRMVTYNGGDMEELGLAYAISVHKSQGSEYPVIILPMVTQHFVMLQRNLLYTALTRARQMVILVGSAKAVRIAVQTDKPRNRNSLLGWRLNPDVLAASGQGEIVYDDPS